MVTATEIRDHLIGTQPGIERWLLEHPLVPVLKPSGLHPVEALPRIVIRQMLSGKASETIIARAEAKAAEQGRARIAELAYVDLLDCGISRAKAQTIQRFYENYQLYPTAIDEWHKLPADELLKVITAHKGIGQWTASILAMFHYAREDIFPLGDSSLRKAIMLMGEQGVYIIPERAAPYRTYLASYLWQLLDQKRI